MMSMSDLSGPGTGAALGRVGLWLPALAVLSVVCLRGLAAPKTADDLLVLPKTIDGGPARDMMKRYLLKQIEAACAERRQRYEQVKTPAQVADYQRRLRSFFLRQLGPLPERTPLEARVTGKVARKGFSVEKVIFQSRPKHYVTAALFLPDPKRHKPPYPGVLVPCGHSRNGKGCDLYQKAAALLAINGLAALVFDPIDQGERGQLLAANGKPPIWGTKAHTMVGVGCILLGTNTASFEIWDGMRGIDYLQSRPEVDPKRIGCTGNSGGGTQTSYFMALDERIVCAAPSCYLTGFERLCQTIGPQDAEQNIAAQVAFGMDHGDYVLMRAPKPTLICCATKDFFDISGTWALFRDAKRLYTRLGRAECVDLAEQDAKHGFNLHLRVAMVRWMLRWLCGRHEPVTEPEDLKILTDEEIRCTPKGEVMLLAGARSTYDLNDDEAARLAVARKRHWQPGRRGETLRRIRELAGIRPLGKLPAVAVETGETIRRDGYRVEKLVLKPEAGIHLPALRFIPAKPAASEPPVLYVHEAGKTAETASGEAVAKLLAAGRTVLAVDLRGIGETAQTTQRYFIPQFGPDGQDAYSAYLLGRSFVGMRAEDILVCARWLARQSKARGGVALLAVGHVGVPALHAAALEPDTFQSVELRRMLVSWSDVIARRLVKRQLINAVHGALHVYDLPDLAGLLGKKLTIAEPVDATGRPTQTP